MKKMIGITLMLSGISMLTGCVMTNETPLAPNVVRLDTQARGALFTGMAGTATLRRAAELTIARGYSYFRLERALTENVTIDRGYVGNTTVYGTVYGSPGFASYNGIATTTWQHQTMPESNVGVTVVMFHKHAPNAFDAAEVLKQ